MIREIRIRNYKSIVDHTIELGRINIFIGENGCGKTNILEAIAMAGAAAVERLHSEELHSRGVRVARPSATFSSFSHVRPDKRIRISFTIEEEPSLARQITTEILAKDPKDIASGWIDQNSTPPVAAEELRSMARALETRLTKLTTELEAATRRALKSGIVSPTYLRKHSKLVAETESLTHTVERTLLAHYLRDYVIYNLNSPALRGIVANSRREPLGLGGENLDILLGAFDKSDFAELAKAAGVIGWMQSFFIDADDLLKMKGYKFGRSASLLYFRDRFMRQRGNILSAENANEGVLHVLFYLALFASDRTPQFFSIDNVETGLNPRLCRTLTKDLARLAEKHDKQALITTHNPAVLDGLNLHDDNQRLFVVYRNDEGCTQTRRIRLKPTADRPMVPLSELWMQGHLGGLPKHF